MGPTLEKYFSLKPRNHPHCDADFCSPLAGEGVYRHWGGLPRRRKKFASLSFVEGRRWDHAQRVEVCFGIAGGPRSFGWGGCRVIQLWKSAYWAEHSSWLQ